MRFLCESILFLQFHHPLLVCWRYGGGGLEGETNCEDGDGVDISSPVATNVISLGAWRRIGDAE